MPHKCVRCAKIFANNALQLLKGCECGSRVFVFLRDNQVTLHELEASGVTPTDAQRAAAALEEVDVRELGWLEEELATIAREQPVSIEFDAAENLKVLEVGSYELNVSSLLKGDPLVIKSDKGVYYIKLPEPKTQRIKRRK